MKHVTFHLPSFLRRVRIHGGEFDSSARAMNRAEQVRLLQAEPRIVRGSTTERKQMSTKTTFKRVALVAVAALGLGVLSVAPSNAAAQLDSIAVSLASTTQNTTETLTATASVLTATLAGTQGVDTLTVTASIVSGPAYVQPILTLKETTTAASSGSGTSVVTVTPLNPATVTEATGKFNLYLNAPSKVGTYLVKLTPTGGTNAAAVTVSIVVSAIKIQGPSATNSKMYLSVSSTTCVEDRGSCVQGDLNGRYSALYANDGNGYGMGGITAANLVDTKTIGVTGIGTMIGTGAWVLKGANAAVPAQRTPVTLTVTGPAYIAMQTDGTSPYSTPTLGSITEAKAVTVPGDPYDPASQDGSFWLYSTGAGGVVKVTATMDGVVLGTRSFSIVGSAKSLVFGTPSKSVVGVGETMSVTVAGADSLATSTGAASVWASSSDATIATVNSTQASTVVVTGVKSGTATITVRNALIAADATLTKTLAIKVGAKTAKTVTFSFDNMTPQPGEKVTMTVEALDASGNAVGDGPRALFSATGIATGLAVQGSTLPTGAAATLVGGKASYVFYAPTGTGSLVVSATQGADLDNVVALATSAATISGTLTVINPSADAATDAANEALDAANAATDAALAAAEAADAATTAAQEASDAVAALSETVTKLIAGLQAQIKSLAAVVAKIAKKVQA